MPHVHVFGASGGNPEGPARRGDQKMVPISSTIQASRYTWKTAPRYSAIAISGTATAPPTHLAATFIAGNPTHRNGRQEGRPPPRAERPGAGGTTDPRAALLPGRGPTPGGPGSTPPEEARDALLAAITKQVAVAPNATTLLRLAEAYAWTVAPEQAHGGAGEK